MKSMSDQTKGNDQMEDLKRGNVRNFWGEIIDIITNGSGCAGVMDEIERPKELFLDKIPE